MNHSDKNRSPSQWATTLLREAHAKQPPSAATARLQYGLAKQLLNDCAAGKNLVLSKKLHEQRQSLLSTALDVEVAEQCFPGFQEFYQTQKWQSKPLITPTAAITVIDVVSAYHNLSTAVKRGAKDTDTLSDKASWQHACTVLQAFDAQFATPTAAKSLPYPTEDIAAFLHKHSQSAYTACGYFAAPTAAANQFCLSLAQYATSVAVSHPDYNKSIWQYLLPGQITGTAVTFGSWPAYEQAVPDNALMVGQKGQLWSWPLLVSLSQSLFAKAQLTGQKLPASLASVDNHQPWLETVLAEQWPQEGLTALQGISLAHWHAFDLLAAQHELQTISLYGQLQGLLTVLKEEGSWQQGLGVSLEVRPQAYERIRPFLTFLIHVETNQPNTCKLLKNYLGTDYDELQALIREFSDKDRRGQYASCFNINAERLEKLLARNATTLQACDIALEEFSFSQAESSLCCLHNFPLQQHHIANFLHSNAAWLQYFQQQSLHAELKDQLITAYLTFLQNNRAASSSQIRQLFDFMFQLPEAQQQHVLTVVLAEEGKWLFALLQSDDSQVMAVHLLHHYQCTELIEPLLQQRPCFSNQQVLDLWSKCQQIQQLQQVYDRRAHSGLLCETLQQLTRFLQRLPDRTAKMTALVLFYLQADIEHHVKNSWQLHRLLAQQSIMKRRLLAQKMQRRLTATQSGLIKNSNDLWLVGTALPERSMVNELLSRWQKPLQDPEGRFVRDINDWVALREIMAPVQFTPLFNAWRPRLRPGKNSFIKTVDHLLLILSALNNAQKTELYTAWKTHLCNDNNDAPFIESFQQFCELIRLLDYQAAAELSEAIELQRFFQRIFYSLEYPESKLLGDYLAVLDSDKCTLLCKKFAPYLRYAKQFVNLMTPLNYQQSVTVCTALKTTLTKADSLFCYSHLHGHFDYIFAKLSAAQCKAVSTVLQDFLLHRNGPMSNAEKLYPLNKLAEPQRQVLVQWLTPRLLDADSGLINSGLGLYYALLFADKDLRQPLFTAYQQQLKPHSGFKLASDEYAWLSSRLQQQQPLQEQLFALWQSMLLSPQSGFIGSAARFQTVMHSLPATKKPLFFAAWQKVICDPGSPFIRNTEEFHAVASCLDKAQQQQFFQAWQARLTTTEPYFITGFASLATVMQALTDEQCRTLCRTFLPPYLSSDPAEKIYAKRVYGLRDSGFELKQLSAAKRHILLEWVREALQQHFVAIIECHDWYWQWQLSWIPEEHRSPFVELLTHKLQQADENDTSRAILLARQIDYLPSEQLPPFLESIQSLLQGADSPIKTIKGLGKFFSHLPQEKYAPVAEALQQHTFSDEGPIQTLADFLLLFNTSYEDRDKFHHQSCHKKYSNEKALFASLKHRLLDSDNGLIRSRQDYALLKKCNCYSVSLCNYLNNDEKAIIMRNIYRHEFQQRYFAISRSFGGCCFSNKAVQKKLAADSRSFDDYQPRKGSRLYRIRTAMQAR